MKLLLSLIYQINRYPQKWVDTYLLLGKTDTFNFQTMNPAQQANTPMENQLTNQPNNQSIRAIKIDVFTQTIYPVILQHNDGSLLKSMYAAIGCRLHVFAE